MITPRCRPFCLAVTLLCTFGCERAGQREARQVGLFAPPAFAGIDIWKGSFSVDENALYFFRQAPGEEQYHLVVSERSGDTWASPQAFHLGGQYSDLYPTISPDGQRLVFTSYRPVPNASAERPNAHLWMSTRSASAWGPAVYLSELNVEGRYHSQPHFDARGTLYFRRDAPGGRSMTTYASRWNGSRFEAPVPFDPINRWTSWRSDLFVWGGTTAPNGESVVLEVSARDSAGRPGPSDLWITCLCGGQDWAEPRPLGDEVNSPANENFPFFTPRGDRLFFVRDNRSFLYLPTRGLCARVRAPQ